jgi:Na+/H+ antiporter NhaA
MSDQLKVQLISAAKTFGVVFLITVATVLTQDGTAIEWTSVFWFSIITAGVRAGVSAVIAPFIPVKLGGKK